MLLKSAQISYLSATHIRIRGLNSSNLDVATLSWAMRLRPTWDRRRVPPRARHNWFKACSELLFCCNPRRLEEVSCLQRCSSCHSLPSRRWSFPSRYLPLLTNPAHCLLIHCGDYRRIVPVVTDYWQNYLTPLTPPLFNFIWPIQVTLLSSSSFSLTGEMPLVYAT